MASAPFSPATTTPQDNDIVSQYPAAERTFRDVITSFIETDHDATTGGHNKVTLVAQGSSPSFTGTNSGLWAIADGSFRSVLGSGTVEEFGVPVGTLLPTFRTTAAAGYLLCYGQDISRTTYSRLWVALGSPNTGNGTTTFTMPDLRGRTLFGKDDMGGSAASRLTTAAGNLDGATLGAAGGSQSVTLDTTMIPSHPHTSPALTDPGHIHAVSTGTLYTQGGNQAGLSFGGGIYFSPATVSTATTGITLAANTGNTGGGAAHFNIPPALVCNWIMKY